MKKTLMVILLGSTFASQAFPVIINRHGIENEERSEFVAKSRVELNRAWTETEIKEFQDTNIIPASIRTHLTEDQIIAYTRSFRYLTAEILLAGEIKS